MLGLAKFGATNPGFSSAQAHAFFLLWMRIITLSGLIRGCWLHPIWTQFTTAAKEQFTRGGVRNSNCNHRRTGMQITSRMDRTGSPNHCTRDRSTVLGGAYMCDTTKTVLCSSHAICKLFCFSIITHVWPSMETLWVSNMHRCSSSRTNNKVFVLLLQKVLFTSLAVRTC